MKYEIRKFNYGGAMFTPIIETMPGTSSTSSGSSRTSSDDDTSNKKESSVLDDEILERLYQVKGLTNDVHKFISEISELEDAMEFSLSDTNNRTKLLHIIDKSNEISESKEYWKDAIGRAKETGGLGEIAVDNEGRVFVKDKKNNILSLSPENVLKNKGKYSLLSVQELMYERQNNPLLAGKNQVFTVADNAIGIKEIGDHISKILSTFGKEDSKSESVFSKSEAAKQIQSLGGKKPSEQDIESLLILKQVASGYSDYSKVKIEKSSERNNLTAGLNYIWNSLGSPAQNKLKALSKLQGENDASKFLLTMIEKQTDQSTSISVLPMSNQVARGEGSEGSDGSKKVAWTPAELSLMDKLYKPGTTYTINNPNAGVEIQMAATFVGPLYELDKSGAVIEPTMLSNILSKNKYQSILNPHDAYIGDTKIDPSQLGEIVYSGNDIAKVFVPIKQDGSLDLGSMDRFNKVFKVYQENKDEWTVQQAQAYFINNDFPGVKIKRLAGRDGKVSSELVENNAVKPFLAVPILTNSASDLSDNPWMNKLLGNKRESAELIMDRAFTIFGGTPSKPTANNMTPSNPWYNPINEKPYSGTVFIAFRPEASAYLSSMSSHFFGEGVDEENVRMNLQHSANNSYSKADASGKVLYE